MTYYVRERNGRVHRLKLRDGEVHASNGCAVPVEHYAIDEQEFLNIARLRKKDLCGTCFAAKEGGG